MIAAVTVPDKPRSLELAEAELAHLDAQLADLAKHERALAEQRPVNPFPLPVDRDIARVAAEVRGVEVERAAALGTVRRARLAHLRVVQSGLAQRRVTAVLGIKAAYAELLAFWTKLDALDGELKAAGGTPAMHLSAAQFQAQNAKFIADVTRG